MTIKYAQIAIIETYMFSGVFWMLKFKQTKFVVFCWYKKNCSTPHLSHPKNHPSPELAPVTMTTVFRGSTTTGILGLDPITDFPDYWTVLDFPNFYPIVNKFIQREYSYPHSDTIQLNSNVSSDPSEWETCIKLVLSGSCIEKIKAKRNET